MFLTTFPSCHCTSFVRRNRSTVPLLSATELTRSNNKSLVVHPARDRGPFCPFRRSAPCNNPVNKPPVARIPRKTPSPCPRHRYPPQTQLKCHQTQAPPETPLEHHFKAEPSKHPIAVPSLHPSVNFFFLPDPFEIPVPRV